MEVDGNIVFFNEAEAVASLNEYADEDETKPRGNEFFFGNLVFHRIYRKSTDILFSFAFGFPASWQIFRETGY